MKKILSLFGIFILLTIPTFSVPNVVCSDSDGRNLFTLGMVVYKTKIYTDTCVSKNYIKEYQCKNNHMSYVYYFCKTGCSSGKCITPIICGDGKINQPTEICDDGNILNGDGCSSICQIESCVPNGDFGNQQQEAEEFCSVFITKETCNACEPNQCEFCKWQ